VGVVNDNVEAEIKELEERVEKVSKDEKKEINEKIKKLESLKTLEITPYRIESKYSDNRRPDEVKFSKKLEDDLKRRDFTINALCYDPESREVVDLFGGISDLQKREIKAIGEADDRFQEDALRMLRAIRFSAQLSFKIEKRTAESILKNHQLLKNISLERIRDEFIKILLTDNPIEAFFQAKDLNILSYISKDLERGIGVEQNGAHRYDVFEHLLRTMQHSADRK
jgi:tRNA nucleotidyltransferase/poly(A) polymerase